MQSATKATRSVLGTAGGFDQRPEERGTTSWPMVVAECKEPPGAMLCYDGRLLYPHIVNAFVTFPGDSQV
jgi:hypothetical protein